MTFEDVLKIATTILASLGGGAAIVFGLSNWLGKVWAERLMARERQVQAVELETLRDALRQSTDAELKSLEAQLEIAKKEHTDRLTIYRGTIDLLAAIVAKVVMISSSKRGPLTPDEFLEFENQRLRVYAYLAIHAPQTVMDAHDSLMDLILGLVADGKVTTWPEIREQALKFLNEVRIDVDRNKQPIAYKGSR
jgi:hypothetical protein